MLTYFRWSKTHKRIKKIKCIDCNIAIDHTGAYYSFILNLQIPGHHTNVIGLFFTHHRHLMLSHPDLQQLQGFGSYPQLRNAQCPQTDGMYFTLSRE